MENTNAFDIMENCNKCGKPYVYHGDIPPEGFPKGLEPYCTCSENVLYNPPSKIPFPNYGWICPVCGAGLSPYTAICPCKPIKYEITC